MRNEKPRQPRPDPNDELNLGSFAGVGLQFAVAIVIFLLIGQWADKKLGTSPILLLAGVFIGGGAAFYSMYRRISAAQKTDDERRRSDKEKR